MFLDMDSIKSGTSYYVTPNSISIQLYPIILPIDGVRISKVPASSAGSKFSSQSVFHEDKKKSGVKISEILARKR